MKSCVLISNFFNRHQLPFSEAISSRMNYTFIEMGKIDSEHIKLGYPDIAGQYEFVLSDGGGANAEKARELVEQANVVISGGPEPLIFDRVMAGGLTFIYTERILKRGLLRFASPNLHKYLKATYSRIARFENLHILAAGAYCPFDMRLLGIPTHRIWKWGYFPVLVPQDEAVKKENEIPLILWAGRMIGWKHAEDILYAVDTLKTKCKFKVRIIGTGEKKGMLEDIIRERNLGDAVEILSAMPQNQILNEMKQADIYVLPSDQQEGWGAVINESLSAECCVISSRSVGAAPWMIKNGETGFTYQSNNIKELKSILEVLITDSTKRKWVAAKGRENLYKSWTGNVVAERFIKLSEYLLGENQYPDFSEGPCSPAEIIFPPIKLL